MMCHMALVVGSNLSQVFPMLMTPIVTGYFAFLKIPSKVSICSLFAVSYMENINMFEKIIYDYEIKNLLHNILEFVLWYETPIRVCDMVLKPCLHALKFLDSAGLGNKFSAMVTLLKQPLLLFSY